MHQSYGRLRAVLGALLVAVLVAACGGAESDADSSVTDSSAESVSTEAAAPLSGANVIPNPERTGWHGAVLDEPVQRPAFTLTDQQGEAYEFAEETAGKTTLLLYGYTHCPDVCPMHLSSIAVAKERAELSDEELEVVFVTTDPERDDVDRLDEYLDTFDSEFIGLTGSTEEVNQAVTAVGFPVPQREPANSDGGYEVSHPVQALAFTADDQAHLAYPFGVGVDELAGDIEELVSDGFSVEDGASTDDAAEDHGGDHGNEQVDGDFTVTAARIPAPPPDSTAAVYLTLDSASEADDEVVAVTSDAGPVELHTTTIDDDGMAVMEEVSSYPVPADGTWQADPGDDHLMLMDPGELAEGDQVELTLELATGDTVTFVADVVAPSAGHGDSHDDHDDEHGDHDEHGEGHDHDQG